MVTVDTFKSYYNKHFKDFSKLCEATANNSSNGILYIIDKNDQLRVDFINVLSDIDTYSDYTVLAVNNMYNLHFFIFLV